MIGIRGVVFDGNGERIYQIYGITEASIEAEYHDLDLSDFVAPFTLNFTN